MFTSSPLRIMKKHFGLSYSFPDTQSFSHEISTHSCLSCVSPLPPIPCMFSKECLSASSNKLAFHFLLISNRTKWNWRHKKRSGFRRQRGVVNIELSWASFPIEDFLCFPKIIQLPSPANRFYLSSCFSKEFLT